VASGVAVGEDRVRRLLVQTLTGTAVDEVDPDEPAAEPTGTPVEDLDLTSTVAGRSTVEAHPAGETTVLLDTSSGATVAVDQIGALVWSVLDGSGTLGEVVTDLAEVFGAPEDQVATDVLVLVRSLGAAGLLEGVAPPDAPERHVHATVTAG
jgi:hypothetical protein